MTCLVPLPCRPHSVHLDLHVSFFYKFFLSDLIVYLAPTPTPHLDDTAVFGLIDDYIAVASTQEVGALMEESATIMQMPRPTHFKHRTSVTSTKSSSTATHRRQVDEDEISIQTIETADPGSPLLNNDSVAGAMNERRYRYLLEHDLNASCNNIFIFTVFVAHLRCSDFAAVGPISCSNR